MNNIIYGLICLSLGAIAVSQVQADMKIGIKDAFIKSSTAKSKWSIGTGSVQIDLAVKNGEVLITGFKNRSTKPQVDYITSKNAIRLITSDEIADEKYKIKQLWSKTLSAGSTADPKNDGLELNVKKGDMIGFSVGAHGDYACDQIDWPIRIDYSDGESYISSAESKVEQGPVWFYFSNVAGTGSMTAMDDITFSANTGQNIRVPSQDSGYRAGTFEPHIGPSVMHPSNECDAVRVWKAPNDGKVSISGLAKQIGGGDVDIYVSQISEKTADLKAKEESWRFESAQGKKVTANGRPAVQLDIILVQESLRANYHIIAYPGTCILRQWTEYENFGKEPISLRTHGTLLSLGLNMGEDKFTNYWMIGGNSQADQGQLHSEEITGDYTHALNGFMTANFVPWAGIMRKGGAGDGMFIAPDYLGLWQIAVNRKDSGPAMVTTSLRDLATISIAPGEHRKMPYVTFGVINGNLDNMAQNLYDWQYEYMWDFTHDDWYTKMPFTVAWYGDSDNSQQQFAGHLADLDMNWTDYLRSIGMEILWEDAGWSASHHWWEANFEGPDFAQTRRFLDKNDMKLMVWIAGHQTNGLLDSKVAAWGNFQRRTDGMGFDSKIDKSFRKQTEKFLENHPRSSFHTCSGGSTYAHTFEVQRYTDVNYDSDGPGCDFTNAYWSYLETPDKWFDNLNCFIPHKGYYADTAMRFLTQVPKWGLYISDDGIAGMSKICDTYHYMLKVGVAGRWSRIVHPVIKGDDERHYCQRLSYDRTKSMIILKHRISTEVKIYPVGLLPQEKYLVEFEVAKGGDTRTGADLMKNGIKIIDQQPLEMIYLNMPLRPRSGHDTTAPAPPTNVLVRRETNIGYAGTGLYWSPGSDNNWISCYEIKRGDTIIGKAATGIYYFDRSVGWDSKADYCVRTVDGDGNVSAWTVAKPIADEARSFQALGGLFSVSGREGWKAEASSDGKIYQQMKWIPAANPPAADYGGTCIQPGGAEGYWEGASISRVGRGWQQASVDAECSRTWVAPTSGSIRITGRALKEYYNRDLGATLNVRIMQNDTQVWPDNNRAEIKPGDTVGVQHNFELNVATGDAIRFVLGKGTSPANDIIVWMPAITYIGSESKPDESVVRILCGSKSDNHDQSGRKWSADSYFKGGKRITTATMLKSNADDPSLYKLGRTGRDFTYTIPVKQGMYCLRLKFAEPKYEYFFERPFNLTVNGKQVLSNFDICQAARGPKCAYDRLVRYIIPNGDGNIVLHFTGGWEPSQKSAEALIQAIEITPESKPAVRINAGSDKDFVDWNGFVYSADTSFEGGTTIGSVKWVEQASPTLYDQGIYQTARTGKSFTYKIKLPDALYSVHLKFAELWLTETGKRPMDIEINGRLVRKSWDPATQAEKVGMSADIRIEDIIPDKTGLITIKISSTGSNDAILQGIEIE